MAIGIATIISIFMVCSTILAYKMLDIAQEKNSAQKWEDKSDYQQRVLETLLQARSLLEEIRAMKNEDEGEDEE